MTPTRVEFGRLVALTDGVFAIALTLLVLDLAIPAQAAAAPLAEALADTAPRFFAFVISVPSGAPSSSHITSWSPCSRRSTVACSGSRSPTWG